MAYYRWGRENPLPEFYLPKTPLSFLKEMAQGPHPGFIKTCLPKLKQEFPNDGTVGDWNPAYRGQQKFGESLPWRKLCYNAIQRGTV